MHEFEHVFSLVFPFFFVGMWVLVLRILSSMSGWTTLAERFHSPGRFLGQYYRFRSAKLQAVNFSSSLELGVNHEGLYLRPMILFRLFHKPLLIPWREIRAQSVKRLLFNGYRLTFNSCPGITLEVYSRTFEKVKAHLMNK